MLLFIAKGSEGAAHFGAQWPDEGGEVHPPWHPLWGSGLRPGGVRLIIPCGLTRCDKLTLQMGPPIHMESVHHFRTHTPDFFFLLYA